jgi:hypothetical protein
MRTRASEGRDRAKARDVKLGRKPKLTEHRKCEAIRGGDRDREPMREVARSSNVSHSTISRLASLTRDLLSECRQLTAWLARRHFRRKKANPL